MQDNSDDAQRHAKKVREKSRECHNHKPQPFPDLKRKRKPTNLNKHKPNKRTKSTKISSLFPKRGNRNTKRTEKHKNKMTHGKTYNKSSRRINHKATKTPGWEKRLMKSSSLQTERTWKSSLMHSRQYMVPRAQEPPHALVQMELVFWLTKKLSWKKWAEHFDGVLNRVDWAVKPQHKISCHLARLQDQIQ